MDKKLALQIRSLRGDASQEEMEKRTGIKQQAISRLENPYYGKATLTTLKKIAAACDVGLIVEFVPYSELINRVSGTPYVEHGYRPENMNVSTFDEEERGGTFESPTERLTQAIWLINVFRGISRELAGPPDDEGLGNGPFIFEKDGLGSTERPLRIEQQQQHMEMPYAR